MKIGWNAETLMLLCAIYYAGINLILFAIMGIDKRKAVKNRYRVPEKSLFMLACFGGCVGGLFGMCLFRHKNRKLKFWVVYLLAVAAHMAIWVWLYWAIL